MRLLTFSIDGKTGFGALKGDRVVDLGVRLGPECHSLLHLIAQDRVSHAAQVVAAAEPDFALEDIRYLPPIAGPEKIICIGINYAKRDAEYKDGEPLQKYPSVFMRTRASLVGHLEPILRPPESEQLDYEGEIAIIIGKEGRRIPEPDAENYIVGLTLLNEGTIRDWVRHAKFNATQGKNFEKSGSIGPWIVTPEEFSSYDNLRVRTKVNGELRQDDTTANLMFPFRYLISYLSTFMRLKPGDIISTGTPTGAGARFDPPRYLVPGDVVEVEVDEIGKLLNTVADETV